MSIGFIFWLIMLCWLLFGAGIGWPRDAANRYTFGSWIILWLLLALLGWRVWGFPITG